MNRLQRRYSAWAEPRYARMSPEQRGRARAIDRYLHSRRALGFWFCFEPALHGGELHPSARRDDDGFVLDVVNSGQPLADGAPEGVGLRNSRERLRGQHGERARLYIPAATAHEATAPHPAESQ